MSTQSRMAHPSFGSVVLFGGSVLGLHFLASAVGWYGAFAHMDTLLHFLGGAFLAYAWVVWRRWRWGGDWVSGPEYAMALMGFVWFGGIAWEILEYLAFTYVPHQAIVFEFYSATVSDLLADLVMDTLGGLAMLWIAQTHIRTHIRKH